MDGLENEKTCSSLRKRRYQACGMVMLDEHGYLTFIDESAAWLLGLDPQDVKGRPFHMLPVDEACLTALLLRASYHHEDFVTTGGRMIRVIKLPSHLIGGGWSGTVLLIQDRSEDHQVREELAATKRMNYYLTTALDALFEDILIADKEGHIVFVGTHTASKMGLDKSNIDRTLQKLDPKCVLLRVLRSGKGKVLDLWENRYSAVPTLVLPLRDEHGELIGGVAKSIFRDLEEAREFARRYSEGPRNHVARGTDARQALRVKFTFEDIIGRSEAMIKTVELAKKAAATDATVLLMGESGTGKELFAHAIHAASRRASGPFIKLNCAAIPETLLEAELFGYEEGAFTGARKGGKLGKFEQAHNGTIFLDEIGDMGAGIQAKLLRVLQEREIQRVGGTETLEVNVRVIAATNYNLWRKVEEGAFRRDLYYRLDVLSISIPPLRHRVEDLPLLVGYIVEKLNYSRERSILGVSPEVMELFKRYSWPGNVRELQNVLEGAACLCGGDVIGMADLPSSFLERVSGVMEGLLPDGGAATQSAFIGLPVSEGGSSVLDSLERSAIQNALRTTRGNKTEAARLLGIPKSSLYYKLKRYGVE